MATNTLTTKLRLDGAAWNRGLQRAERQAKQFGRNLVSQVGGALGLGGGIFGANQFFSTDIVESQRASEVLGGGAEGGARLRALDESFARLGLEGDGQASQLAGAFDVSLRSALAGDRGAAAALYRQGFATDRAGIEALAADPIAGLTNYALNPPELSDAGRMFNRQDMATLGLEQIWAAQRTRPGLRDMLGEQLERGTTFTQEEARGLKNLAHSMKNVQVTAGRGIEHTGSAIALEEGRGGLLASALGAIMRGGPDAYIGLAMDYGSYRMKRELRPNE